MLFDWITPLIEIGKMAKDSVEDKSLFAGTLLVHSKDVPRISNVLQKHGIRVRGSMSVRDDLFAALFGSRMEAYDTTLSVPTDSISRAASILLNAGIDIYSG